MLRLITLLIIAVVPAFAQAETAYVTDNLRLGLHQAQDTSDRSFRTLESGQNMEIINRDRNYAHVQLPDGTQGYVKAAYLVFDKPAKLIVAETQAQVDQLQAELNKTKEAFAVPGATIASLEQQLAETTVALEKNKILTDELAEQNDSYRDRHDQFKFSLPIAWVGGAMAVCLLAGFLLGLWWVDRNNRKRHGGIRVY
jgi:SH3 domain protein